MAYEFIDPPTLPKPRGRYSQVVKAGSLVFIAGQTSVDLDGEMVGVGDPKAQARQVYTNVKAAVESVGGSLTDIVKVVVYITDHAYFPAVQEGRWEVWPDGSPPPVSTLLVVKGLARAEYMVEVDAIAVLPD